jgi:hypothetical protein
MRNCTRDEGGPFGFGDRELIPSHRKLLLSKAMVVSVAEKAGHDPGRHGRERRAQANRCRTWLANVLARINDHNIHSLDQLLPWNWKTRPARLAA